MWVACDGERVVAFRTFMRWEFQRGDQVFRCVRAVDTATHPDYQGRGLFSQLTRSALPELAADGVEGIDERLHEDAAHGADPQSPLAILGLDQRDAAARPAVNGWTARRVASPIRCSPAGSRSSSGSTAARC